MNPPGDPDFPDSLPTGDMIEVPVPLAVIREQSGTTAGPDGITRFAPPPIELRPAQLTYGGHDLGMWVADSFSVRQDRFHPTEYIAHLRKVGGR